MRFVSTFIIGIATGYFLHTKKDQTIDQLMKNLGDRVNRWEDEIQKRAISIAH